MCQEVVDYINQDKNVKSINTSSIRFEMYVP